MLKTRVGVIRGGSSAEYEVSLKTGQSVLNVLSRDRYDVRDILIDRNGVWHMRGLPAEPTRVLDQVDVVFIALHGAFGEDGTLQRYLDTHGIAYTGSNALSSAIAMNKVLTKSHLKDAPYKHAIHKTLSRDTTDERAVLELFRSFPHPCIVKPVSGGSSVATALVGSYAELITAIEEAFTHEDEVMVEGYVRGREATVAVADGFRGESLYSFPPIEISYTNNAFFDYDEKYSDAGAREICPAPFDRDTTEALRTAARHVHDTLGLRDYSRSDFIVARDGIYFLEVNTLPGMTPTSLVPKAVEAVGATLPHFLEHLIEQARTRA